MTSNKLVIYHAGCPDGFTAAWVVHSVPGWKHAEFIPARWGDDPPNVEGKDVMVVDFGYSKDTILAMREVANSVTVLDHHQSTIDMLGDLEGCTLDVSKSGAMLTWEHFYPDREAPRLVQHIMDRDLWLWKLPHTDEILAYVDTLPYDFDRYDALAELMEYEDKYQEYIKYGEIIINFRNREVDRMCSNAYWGTLPPDENGNQESILMVNASTMMSYIGNKLAAREDNENGTAAVWWIDRRGRRNFSLRAVGNASVRELCEARGGGGHPKAAGFVVGEVDK